MANPIAAYMRLRMKAFSVRSLSGGGVVIADLKRNHTEGFGAMPPPYHFPPGVVKP